MIIGLIDPAIYPGRKTSPNIGDQIISRAVKREIRELFGNDTEIVSVSSHQYPSLTAMKALQATEHVFVGGSNLLWFRWWRPASWKIGPVGLVYYRNLILLGVGWGAYNISKNTYGRWVCRTILSQTCLHSVRDTFTRSIVDRDLKVPRVTNTACPTMWRLTNEVTGKIRTSKGTECIFALTDYSKNPRLDGQLIQDLSASYGGRLLFWPQGEGDLQYCRALGYSGRVLDRSLDALLSLLSSGTGYDYVGTRLHAGILCLEHGVRSLIISIDNRAREIATDTGLPSVEREDRIGLLHYLEGESKVRIRLPLEEIERWRSQFHEAAPASLPE